METVVDVVVVGGGAGGLSAAIVVARAMAKVVLVDGGEPRNAPADGVHGFVSREGVSPAALIGLGREEFLGFGGTLVEGRVDEVRRIDDRFVVAVGDRELTARAVVVATGMTDVLPPVPGVAELWGSGVHHCPHCHGFESRGRDIVLIGGQIPPMTLHQAALLRRFSDSVTLCLNGMTVPPGAVSRLEAFGVRVIDTPVTAVEHDNGHPTTVRLTNGRSLPAQVVFVGPTPAPHDELLRELGCTVDDQTGLVRVDAAGATSVPGVWAVGNVVDVRAQVVTAAGQGSTAGIAVTGWLLERDVDAAQASGEPFSEQ